MKKSGLNIGEIEFSQVHSGGESSVFFSVLDGELAICTTNSADESQHDFTISKNEWEIIKRVIDINLA
ncbi:hypothetical protein M222_0720 [Enterococcus faecalis AZ19]|uniref:hypothetical protein n=1 Tax=Enterococcus faecalis TaxID=1351 RepID=UPI00032DB7AA|nr:hypothetical protein [Enterococcus faecalis]EOJ06430.1 hypothetical protein UMI_00860 [Enterococcus faecalis EnGen0282]KAJ76017.1 hypothetical protein M222_0720 [Enterococcus faecalis AZ19]